MVYCKFSVMAFVRTTPVWNFCLTAQLSIFLESSALLLLTNSYVMNLGNCREHPGTVSRFSCPLHSRRPCETFESLLLHPEASFALVVHSQILIVLVNSMELRFFVCLFFFLMKNHVFYTGKLKKRILSLVYIRLFWDFVNFMHYL